MNDQSRINKLLFMLMEHDISRYLLVNSKGREDGYEKATRHLNLSYTFVASKISDLSVDVDSAKTITIMDDYKFLYSMIHDATRELTDNLDEEIGFKTEDEDQDFGNLIIKFFNRFIELAEEEYSKNIEGKELDI